VFQKCRFESVFREYDRILSKNRKLHSRILQLERDVSTFPDLHKDLSSPTGSFSSTSLTDTQHIQSGTGAGDLHTQQLIQSLETKTSKQAEELSDMYKQKAEQSDALLRLKEQIERGEHALLARDQELEAKSRRIEDLTDAVQVEQKRSKALEATVELLRTELASSRIRVEQYDNKIAELNAENRDLLDRIMSIKTAQADEMNEVAELHEKLRHYQELAEARQRAASDTKVAPDMDLSNQNSILDAVAWQSHFNVQVPENAKNRILAHGGHMVASVRCNAAGTLVASGGADKLVRVWDARTGSSRATLRGATQTVICVAFAANDEYIIGSGNEAFARVWSMRTGRLIHSLAASESQSSVKTYACCFTNDSSRALTGSHNRTIRLWDMKNGLNIHTMMCKSSVNGMSLSPNGDLLASAHLDRHVRFWSVTNREHVHEANLHVQQVTGVQFSPDGSQVLTSGRDNCLKLLDIRTWKVVRTFRDEKHDYHCGVNYAHPAFSPDGRYVISGGTDGAVHVWEADSGKALAPLTVELSRVERANTKAGAGRDGQRICAVTCVDWNRNGQQVVSSDNLGRLIMWS
jgi:autophagy-related protein 16-1